MWQHLLLVEHCIIHKLVCIELRVYKVHGLVTKRLLSLVVKPLARVGRVGDFMLDVRIETVEADSASRIIIECRVSIHEVRIAEACNRLVLLLLEFISEFFVVGVLTFGGRLHQRNCLLLLQRCAWRMRQFARVFVDHRALIWRTNASQVQQMWRLKRHRCISSSILSCLCILGKRKRWKTISRRSILLLLRALTKACSRSKVVTEFNLICLLILSEARGIHSLI